MSTTKNVIWIVIDTLRADMLACCGADFAEPNAIDEVMSKGALFTQVFNTGASTRISAPSYFTSLRPGFTGVLNHDVQALRSFKDDAVTITDHFRRAGYKTFRWDDSSLDSCQPKTGFEVFESGYHTLEHTPDKDYDNPRRDAFIRKVRSSDRPVFAYFHLDWIHDFGGYDRRVWTTSEYLDIVKAQARDFGALWRKLAPGRGDIVLVSSDHGCTLDEDYREFDKNRPWAFTTTRLNVAASFIGESIAPATHHKLVRNLDLAPTLMELALGQDMRAQGVSLAPVLRGGQVPRLVGIGERDKIESGIPTTKYVSVRDNKWTYVMVGNLKNAEGSFKGGWLCHDSDGPFVVNRIGQGLAVEKRLERYCREHILSGPATASELYRSTGQDYARTMAPLEASILLPLTQPPAVEDASLRRCIDSLLDQIGYTELLVLDGDETGGVARFLERHYAGRLFLRRIAVSGSLPAMLDAGLEQARAPLAVTATPLCEYTEDFCYELRKVFEEKQDVSLAYPNLFRILQDKRDMEYLGNHECFKELLFSRLGCGYEHHAPEAVRAMPHWDVLGACAMFACEDLRRRGGFAACGPELAHAWHALAQEGCVRHVNKGLVVTARRDFLRPRMPGWNGGRSPCPAVSVLVPVQDAAAARKALVMLSAQVFQDFEVLLLGDEASRAALEQAAAGCPHLQTRVMAEAAADFTARCNQGLAAASGRWLFWLDPGDRLLPECLHRLAARLQTAKEARAARCTCLQGARGGAPQERRPARFARELLQELHDLRGLLYARELHHEVGVFDERFAAESSWEMSVRLALAAPALAEPAPLLVAASRHHFALPMTVASFRRIVRRASRFMGGYVDLVRLYEDDFLRHDADQARYILEDEMTEFLRLLGSSDARLTGLLRVPKVHSDAA